MEKSKSYIKNLLIVLFCTLCAVVVYLVFQNSFVGDKNGTVKVLTPNPVTVIIDAGHGGEDCGTIGVNGVYEKDINLSVANELERLLEEQGVNVIMTRREDKLLYTEAQNIKGQKKQFGASSCET